MAGGGSLERVRAALATAGVTCEIVESDASTRTAAEAAAAAGCDVDQIVKSIIFRGEATGAVFLFLTPGGQRVCPEAASALAGEALGKADAALIRARTGFAIGGVSPVGHLAPVQTWIEAGLMAYSLVWAAAGTPRHNFAISPADLARISGATVARFAEL